MQESQPIVQGSLQPNLDCDPKLKHSPIVQYGFNTGLCNKPKITKAEARAKEAEWEERRRTAEAEREERRRTTAAAKAAEKEEVSQVKAAALKAQSTWE